MGVALASVVTPARATTAEVTIAGMAFSPETVTVELTEGEAELPESHAHVNWLMRDEGVEHTVSFDDRSVAVGSSGRLSTGQSYTVIFEEPGNFAYRCEIHPDMTGTVVVTSPASSSRDETDPDGDASGTSIGIVLVVAVLVAATALAAVLLVRRARRPTGLDKRDKRPTRSGRS
jgi:plastocyanin